MKNNIDYYQHFCNSDQHPKFKMLRVKYGWEGEGKFWALNNRIGLADNCRIDLNRNYNRASMATDLDFDIKQFDEFIEYLDNECNLIVRENGYITTEIIIENLERVMQKRKRNQNIYKSRIKETLRNIQQDEKEIKTSENIQSKVNKIKVKENKENNDNIIHIVDYLNQKTDKKFKATSTKTRELIIARINDGFILDDFKKVIDNKVIDWLNEPDWNKFLRPETLFSNKFESYLNQNSKVKESVEYTLDDLEVGKDEEI